MTGSEFYPKGDHTSTPSFFYLPGGGEGDIALRTTLAILLCDKTLAFRSEHPNWDENMQIRFLREYLHMVILQAFS